VTTAYGATGRPYWFECVALISVICIGIDDSNIPNTVILVGLLSTFKLRQFIDSQNFVYIAKFTTYLFGATIGHWTALSFLVLADRSSSVRMQER
jgi:hypothetical protein